MSNKLAEDLTKLTPEQVAEIKRTVDAEHAKRTGEADSIANKSDRDARKTVQEKYGYNPNY